MRVHILDSKLSIEVQDTCMLTANQIIKQNQIIAWKSPQRSDSFADRESGSLVSRSINDYKCLTRTYLSWTRITQGFINNVARCQQIPQIFDRRYFLILLLAFGFIGFPLISGTFCAFAAPELSSVRFDSRPKLGVSFQLGNSLEASSITSIKRSSFNALDAAFRPVALNADRLDSCTSLSCYAKVFTLEAKEMGLKEVILISVESF